MPSVRWILVIEKEVRSFCRHLFLADFVFKATFRSLLSSSQWEEIKLHIVVVTVRLYTYTRFDLIL